MTLPTDWLHNESQFGLLLGQRLLHEGMDYTVTDVIWSERIIVVQEIGHKEIQTDQYGRPYRITHEHRQICLAQYDNAQQQWLPTKACRNLVIKSNT